MKEPRCSGMTESNFGYIYVAGQVGKGEGRRGLSSEQLNLTNSMHLWPYELLSLGQLNPCTQVHNPLQIFFSLHKCQWDEKGENRRGKCFSFGKNKISLCLCVQNYNPWQKSWEVAFGTGKEKVRKGRESDWDGDLNIYRRSAADTSPMCCKERAPQPAWLRWAGMCFCNEIQLLHHTKYSLVAVPLFNSVASCLEQSKLFYTFRGSEYV